jgi:thermostable 8-oxoguanine DNA glycosylase
MKLHPIDRIYRRISDERLQEMMVFCMLDSSTPYDRVCKAFDKLKLVTDSYRKGSMVQLLKDAGVVEVRHWLKQAGYPFYNQKARYLVKWARNYRCEPWFLRGADRYMLMEIEGVGMKLASMFQRNALGADVAVIDRHIARWMHKPVPTTRMAYWKMERTFKRIAEYRNMTTADMDLEIWKDATGNGKVNKPASP